MGLEHTGNCEIPVTIMEKMVNDGNDIPNIDLNQGNQFHQNGRNLTKIKECSKTFAKEMGKLSIPGVSGNGCVRIKDRNGSIVVRNVIYQDRQIGFEKQIGIVQ